MLIFASNTLDELIRKGYRVLNLHYMAHFINDPEYQDDEVKRQVVEKFRFLSDKTCTDYYAVKRDLRLLVKNKTLYVVAPPDQNEEQTYVNHINDDTNDDTND